MKFPTGPLPGPASGVTALTEELPEVFGFRNGNSSVHTSRTMMLAELDQLLAGTAANSPKQSYWEASIEHNVLGKRTPVTRKRSVERLTELYGLDPAIPIFRIFRQLWQAESVGRPMLAGLCAHARDTLL